MRRLKSRVSEFRDKFKAGKAGSNSRHPAEDPDTRPPSKAQSSQIAQGARPYFFVVIFSEMG
jgi:hypothetical protein